MTVAGEKTETSADNKPETCGSMVASETGLTSESFQDSFVYLFMIRSS